MKNTLKFGICAHLLAISAVCGAQTVPPPTPWSVASRAADSEILTQTTYQSSPTGQSVPIVHQVTRIASGENYWDGSEWQPSDPTFQVSADGQSVYANQVQMPVRILANLAQSNSVSMTSPDGIVLSSMPVAVGLYDSVSGNSLVIGEITNCSGTLYGNNEVAFTNCFNGISADVLFSLQKGSFSQDIVWEQDINPADYGFPTNSTQIQIFTAINGPAPQQVARPIYPDFIDHTLMFGQLRFGASRVSSTAATKNIPGAPIAKAIETINGQQYLVESIRFTDIKEELQSLPPRTSRLKRHGRHREEIANLSPKVRARGLKNLAVPGPGAAAKTTFAIKAGRCRVADAAEAVIADYVALPATEPDPMVFSGDETYFVNGACEFDNVVLEGGTVIKYPDNTNAYIEVDGNLTCQSQPGLSCVFTAADDDSVGQSMSGVWPGYSGKIGSGGYANPALLLYNPSQLENCRFSYAQEAILWNPAYWGNDISLYDCQVVGCGTVLSDYDSDASDVSIGLENCLVSDAASLMDDNINGSGQTVYCINCTIDNCGTVMVYNSDDAFYATNCIFSDIGSVTNAVEGGVEDFGGPYGSNNGFYNSGAFGTDSITTDEFPFCTVGGGSYYLANGCGFRGAGTPSVDPALLADLAVRTTVPPTVYDKTNISNFGWLIPDVPRDTNARVGLGPDLGWHYPVLDYVFGGCNLTNTLTITNGTAVGWFEDGKEPTSLQPYGICLSSNANLSFSGSATQPCIFARYSMVQEAANGNWTNGGWMGCVMITNGSPAPQLSADFTKFTSDNWSGNIFRDYPPDDVGPDDGQAEFRNCEFYNFEISAFDMASLAFTNCLFFRFNQSFWGDPYYSNSPSLTYENCTFYNGGILLTRYSQVRWLFENCSFDGTAFYWNDLYNGTNYTTMDYNAYNADNLSWTKYPYFSATNHGVNEVAGPHDVTVTNFEWESSFFGGFYQPTNIATFQAGSTNAGALGLYWFTTQTNQTIDGTNQVTIGYNYVATDASGSPLAMCGGTPYYISYPDGPPVLRITVQPTNQNILQGSNTAFSVTATGGVPPLSYQWYWDGTNLSDTGGVSGSASATLMLSGIQPDQAGWYQVVVSDGFDSVASSNATLSVQQTQTNFLWPQYFLSASASWNVTDISDPAQPVDIGELQAPYSQTNYQQGDFDESDLPFPNTMWHTNSVNTNSAIVITNAFGATEFGGASNMGTVFEVGLTGGVKTIYTFTNSLDGACPCSQLAISGSPFYGFSNILFGTTLGGGSNGYGTVFKLNADGSGFTDLYDFTDCGDGEYPRNGLLIDGNTLYGTTSNSIFKINTDGREFVRVAGVTNASQLVLSLSGNTLYGTTTNGGTNNLGMVFSISTAGTNFNDLYAFTGTNGDGAIPMSGLEILECANAFENGSTMDTLYGTTYGGGASNLGMVFSINTDGSGFADLHDFTGTNDGANPIGGLLLTNNNANLQPYLYGTTSAGGTSNCGTVFGINQDGVFTNLWSFSGTNGANPEGKLVLVGQTLYGTTYSGGTGTNGTVFEIDTGDGGFTNLYNFTGGLADGCSPAAGLALPVVDNLWSIWSLDTSIDVPAGDLTNLFYSTAVDDSFALFVNGAYIGYYFGDAGAAWLPLARLTNLHPGGNDIRVIIAGNGDFNDYATMFIKYAPNTLITNLFGTTYDGGSNNNGDGTIFEITPSGSETTLYNFSGSSNDGEHPVGDLILSSNTLYGVTEYGGANNDGTIFSYTLGSTTDAVLHSFNYTNIFDGQEPKAGLTLSGNTLYGTTYEGGSNNADGASGLGTIFKINTDGSGYTSLYSFAGQNYNCGAYPIAPLLFVANTLYGTTSAGGNAKYSGGTVFSFAIDGSVYSNLYVFGTAADDGGDCEAGLIASASGTTFYGTTKSGGLDSSGTAQGTVFSFTLGSATDVVLHTFSNTPDGENPQAGLLLLGSTLYGTTYGGGEWGLGTVFSIGANGTNYTIIRSLGEIDTDYGANPQYADLLNLSNFLYGALSGGGAGYGMVFSINATNNFDFNDIHSFSNSPDGVFPQGGVCSP